MGLASITNNILTDTGITPSGVISGSGAANQVTYWTGTNAVSGSANFTWNNATSILTVGGTTTSDSGVLYRFVGSATNSRLGVYDTAKRGVYIGSLSGYAGVYGYDYTTPGAIKLILQEFGGNVSIGSTSDGGQRLQVYGDAFIRGTGNTNTTNALAVQNSDSLNLFRQQNDGSILFGSSANAPSVYPANTSGALAVNGDALTFSVPSVFNSASVGTINFTGNTFVSTSGFNSIVSIYRQFIPTSGNASVFYLNIVPTVNQSAGGTGRTVGIRISPNLTSAADWRSIDIENSVGWGIYGSGTANNYLAGSLGIGSTALTGKTLVISKNITGSTIPDAVQNNGVIQSDVTNATNYFITSASTAAAAFTLPTLRHYIAVQGTFGAGSSVTNQYGYFAHGSMVGATNNYGFYGDIAAAAGRWNLYMAGTADNYIAGRLGLGSTALTFANFRVSSAVTGNVNSTSIFTDSVIQSDVTSSGTGYYSGLQTAAASFTLANLRHFIAEAGTFGAGSVVTTQSGFTASSNLTGATNNYGFRGSIAAATGRWNIYMDGTAANYLAGVLQLGSATALSPNEILQVTGNGIITGSLGFGTDGNRATILASGTNSRGILIQDNASGTANYSTLNIGNGTKTASGRPDLELSSNYNYTAIPTAGSSKLLLTGTYTEAVGGAEMHGIYINTTIGTTNNYRAIQWTNNNGWGLYGSGTASNYLRGALAVGGTNVFATIHAQGNTFTTTTQTFLLSQPTIVNPVTDLYAIRSNIIGSGAATITNAYHYSLRQSALGSSVITNQFGYYVENITGATNNYGFYGDIAAGTGRWNLYMNGTANNYMLGALGIGSTSLTGVSLLITRDITGGTTSYGARIASQVQSDVTGSALGLMVELGTAATAFSVSGLNYYTASQLTIGAGSSIGEQNGFHVYPTLIGASLNVGFRARIPSGTGRWNMYLDGTANNYMAGRLGIGSTVLGDINFRVSNNLSGSVGPTAVYVDGMVTSTSTSVAGYFLTAARTEAAAFNLPSFIHYSATQGTFGAGSTVTNQYGFHVQSNLIGATNNYGFFGAIPAAANRWNLYMNGTAINYLNGALLIGSATDDTVNKLQVTGTIVAGSNTSTNGSVILRGSYTSGYLTTIGTDASSGGPIVSYGVESAQNSTAGSFVSSSGIGAPTGILRSAYIQNGNHAWYTAPASVTPVGTAISMTKHLELYNSGNLVLGGAAEVAGYKLQVNGDTLLKGSGNTNTTFGLTVQNNNGNVIASFRNDRYVVFGAQSLPTAINVGGINTNSLHIYQTNDPISANVANQDGYFIGSIASTNSQYSKLWLGYTPTTGFNSTSGNPRIVTIQGSFIPTTGNATFASLALENIINQTGSTGISRGLYINPTLTSAFDWRSIEWSNNTGWGIYGAGTAPNFMNGRLTVSSAIAQTGNNSFATLTGSRIGLFGSQTLDVPTTGPFSQGTVSAAGTSAQYITFNGNTTIGGDALVAGSVHINSVQFATTGTITMADSATNSPRTLSVMQLQMQKAGTIGGTITKGSTLYLFGVYPTTSTGGTVTFTEYAGLRIGNLTEWTGGPSPNTTVALTNRWGIYQEGSTDPNYFAGSVGIGVATNNASAKLQVDSTTQGFLPPRMTTAQRNGIATPAAGLIVYDTTDNKHYGYNGTTWNAFY